MALPRVPPHPVENETHYKLKAPQQSPQVPKPGAAGEPGLRKGGALYLGRRRGAAAHLSAPGRLGGAGTHSSARGCGAAGPSSRLRRPQLQAGSRVWSDRFEVGRPRPPPLPALREAARVRRSSRGRGARGRSRHEDTQALRAEQGRPRRTGQGRPSSRSWMRIPRARLCPGDTHRRSPSLPRGPSTSRG